MNLKQYFTINYWLNRIVLVFKEPDVPVTSRSEYCYTSAKKIPALEQPLL